MNQEGRPRRRRRRRGGRGRSQEKKDNTSDQSPKNTPPPKEAIQFPGFGGVSLRAKNPPLRSEIPPVELDLDLPPPKVLRTKDPTHSQHDLVAITNFYDKVLLPQKKDLDEYGHSNKKKESASGEIHKEYRQKKLQTLGKIDNDLERKIEQINSEIAQLEQKKALLAKQSSELQISEIKKIDDEKDQKLKTLDLQIEHERSLKSQEVEKSYGTLVDIILNGLLHPRSELNKLFMIKRRSADVFIRHQYDVERLEHIYPDMGIYSIVRELIKDESQIQDRLKRAGGDCYQRVSGEISLLRSSLRRNNLQGLATLPDLTNALKTGLNFFRARSYHMPLVISRYADNVCILLPLDRQPDDRFGGEELFRRTMGIIRYCMQETYEQFGDRPSWKTKDHSRRRQRGRRRRPRGSASLQIMKLHLANATYRLRDNNNRAFVKNYSQWDQAIDFLSNLLQTKIDEHPLLRFANINCGPILYFEDLQHSDGSFKQFDPKKYTATESDTLSTTGSVEDVNESKYSPEFLEKINGDYLTFEDAHTLLQRELLGKPKSMTYLIESQQFDNHIRYVATQLSPADAVSELEDVLMFEEPEMIENHEVYRTSNIDEFKTQRIIHTDQGHSLLVPDELILLDDFEKYSLTYQAQKKKLKRRLSRKDLIPFQYELQGETIVPTLRRSRLLSCDDIYSLQW